MGLNAGLRKRTDAQPRKQLVGAGSPAYQGLDDNLVRGDSNVELLW